MRFFTIGADDGPWMFTSGLTPWCWSLAIETVIARELTGLYFKVGPLYLIINMPSIRRSR